MIKLTKVILLPIGILLLMANTPINAQKQGHDEDSLSQAEKDWAYFEANKMRVFPSTEESKRVSELGWLEKMKYYDKVDSNRSRMVQDFMAKYAENEHYDEAFSWFFSVYFQPMFIPEKMDDEQYRFLSQFSGPMQGTEFLRFMRTLPIEKPAMERWKQKGNDLVAKVLASEAPMEHKAEAEIRLLNRDFNIARELYYNLPKEPMETDYWEAFDAQYWDSIKLRLYAILNTYPDYVPLAGYFQSLLGTSLKRLSPVLAESFIREFFAKTGDNNPQADRPGIKELHTILEENIEALDALKRYEDTDPLEMMFTAMNGTKIDLAAMRGKVVLIDFWSIRCAPCIKEMPHVQTLYEKYREQGFEIIGITSDGTKEQVSKILKKTGATWPQRLDNGPNAKVSYHSLYNITSLPTVWLLDKEGKIVDRNARGERLEPLIRYYLGFEEDSDQIFNQEKVKLQTFAKMEKAEKEQDWKAYTKVAITYVNAYLETDYRGLNDYAWKFVKHPAITDQNALEEALRWSKISIENDKKHYLAFMDTYVWLLFKLKRKEEALAGAEKLLKAYKESGVSNGDEATKELFEKINSL